MTTTNSSKQGKGKGLGKAFPGGKGKGAGKALPPQHTGSHSAGRVTSTSKAGLQFSVARIAKLMKDGHYKERIGGGAPVYMSAAIQYICSEVTELACNLVEQQKKHRITARHIMMAIKQDPELNDLLGKGDFAQCGVVPKKVDYEKKGKKGKCCAVEEDQEMDQE